MLAGELPGHQLERLVADPAADGGNAVATRSSSNAWRKAPLSRCAQEPHLLGGERRKRGGAHDGVAVVVASGSGLASFRSVRTNGMHLGGRADIRGGGAEGRAADK